MTYSAENFSPTFGSRIATDLCATVAALLAHFVHEHRVSRTVRRLSALDDTVLHDIGLDRSQIFRAAHEAVTAGYRMPR